MKTIRFLFMAIVLSLLGNSMVFAGENPVLMEIVAIREGRGVRVDIRADKPILFKSYRMPELAKWVIDIPLAVSAYPHGDESKKISIAPLERITVRPKEVNGDILARIGLDYTGEVECSIRLDQDDKRRIIVFITPRAGSPAGKVSTVPATITSGP